MRLSVAPWRIIERPTRFLVYRDSMLVAEVSTRLPAAKANATAIAHYPGLLDCGFALLEGAGRAAVDGSDMDQALNLLGMLPAITHGPWRARGTSILAIVQRRLVNLAHVPVPATALALAEIPAMLDSLALLAESREAKPVYRVSPDALSALARQFARAAGPAQAAAAARGNPGMLPAPPSKPAGIWRGQVGELPPVSTAQAQPVRFGPRKAVLGESVLVSA